jgi:hypothetical protein
VKQLVVKILSVVAVGTPVMVVVKGVERQMY